MKKFLIRLDDACPTMNVKKWQRIEEILDMYEIRPMVGVIPNNKDPMQQIDVEDVNFWQKVHKWIKKNWTIALHGYDHCYISNDGLKGLNPLWSRSEFAGVPLNIQKEKIRNGVNIFRLHGIDPKYFFAPSHTYDEKTLIALKEESNIRIISDTIATKPYKYGEFTFIPQFGGRCSTTILPGIRTFCLHPSSMTDENFIATEHFLVAHKNKFIGFSDIDLVNTKEKDYLSCFLSWVYFMRRRIKNVL